MVTERPLDDAFQAPPCLFGEPPECLNRARATRHAVGRLGAAHGFSVAGYRSHHARVGRGPETEGFQVSEDFRVGPVLEEPSLGRNRARGMPRLEVVKRFSQAMRVRPIVSDVLRVNREPAKRRS